MTASRSSHPFLQRWSSFAAGITDDGPFVVSDDLAHLNNLAPQHDWSAFARGEVLQGDRKAVHLGVLPQPFLGPIAQGTVFVLMLNPGLSSSDYYAEFNVPSYRERLKITIAGSDSRHLFLDPAYAWHTGFMYWHHTHSRPGRRDCDAHRHPVRPRAGLRRVASRHAGVVSLSLVRGTEDPKGTPLDPRRTEGSSRRCWYRKQPLAIHFWW